MASSLFSFFSYHNDARSNKRQIRNYISFDGQSAEEREEKRLTLNRREYEGTLVTMPVIIFEAVD